MFHPDGPSLIALVEQGLSSTQRGYDLLAPRFDVTPFRTPDDLLSAVAGHIGAPVDRALDVCCGTGAGVRMLRPLCRDEVVGIDFSPGMLAEARRRIVDTPGAARVTLERGDALQLPYTEAFDVVTSFGAFGHFVGDDLRVMLAGIHRALRPGGRFVFVTSDRLSPRTPRYWAYRGFNAVMRVRNLVIRPRFIMYYLHFQLPQMLELLDGLDFEVTVHRAAWRGRPMAVVVATRS